MEIKTFMQKVIYCQGCFFGQIKSSKLEVGNEI